MENLLRKDNLIFEKQEQKIYFSTSKVKEKEQHFLRVGILQENGQFLQQGYIYFYLNRELKMSKFIGLYIKPEFRGKGLASLLLASWIQFCLNYNFEILSTIKHQRKPFLLYLLKKYQFEIMLPERYQTSNKTIQICKKEEDTTKYLLFKDYNYQELFKKSHIIYDDNYVILSKKEEDINILDQVLISTPYYLQDIDKAYQKSLSILKRYH